MLLNEQIETYFIPFLQHDVRFICSDKIIKKGKLLLFAVKGFYLAFTITNDKGIPKTFEIPYPFKIEHTNNPNELVLNYEFIELSNDNAYAQIKITNVPPVKKCKFYNNTVTLEAVT